MSFIIQENIFLKKIGNQFIVYDQNASKSHIVNETAGEVLEMICTNLSTIEIKNVLKKKFANIEGAIIDNDIDEILNNYLELGLICNNPHRQNR